MQENRMLYPPVTIYTFFKVASAGYWFKYGPFYPRARFFVGNLGLCPGGTVVEYGAVFA